MVSSPTCWGSSLTSRDWAPRPPPTKLGREASCQKVQRMPAGVRPGTQALRSTKRLPREVPGVSSLREALWGISTLVGRRLDHTGPRPLTLSNQALKTLLVILTSHHTQERGHTHNPGNWLLLPQSPAGNLVQDGTVWAPSGAAPRAAPALRPPSSSLPFYR